jgi:hypothetical protein
MDALCPPGGAPQAPSSAQRPQPEPQRKSSQPKLSSFFRRASREEVAEQAAERMDVIAGSSSYHRHNHRQNAHSMERPLEMERRVARGVVEFGLVLAWWMLELATDGGPSGQKLQMVDRADNISRTRID